MSTNRRDFLKLAGAAAAAITSTAAAHAGVPASSVAKFDDEYDVVIIGSGFAGLTAARRLKHADADITLLARTSHHLFQPLLLDKRDIIRFHLIADIIRDAQLIGGN